MTEEPKAPTDKEPVVTESMDDRTFSELEKRFLDFLASLEDGDVPDQFKSAFESIYQSLTRSRTSEKRLAMQCRELNGLIVQKTADLERLRQNFADEQSFVQSLNKQIEKAHAMLREHEQREVMANRTILLLKREIAQLGKLAGSEETLGFANERSLEEAQREKAELEAQRKQLMEEISTLQEKLNQARSEIKTSEKSRLDLEHKLHLKESEILARKAEIDRQNKRRTKLDGDMRRLNETLTEFQDLIDRKNAEVDMVRTENENLTRQLRSLEDVISGHKREIATLKDRNLKLEASLNEERRKFMEEERRLTDKEHELALKEREALDLRRETETLERRVRQQQTAQEAIDAERARLDQEKQEKLEEIRNLKRDIALQRKAVVQKDKVIRSLEVQLKNLNGDLTRADREEERIADVNRMLEIEQRRLHEEILSYKKDIQALQQQISTLEKQNMKYQALCSETSSRYLDLTEKLKLSDLEKEDLQKKLADLENKLRQQQNLYESVRSDRNLYSKQLCESHDEILELRRKFQTLDHEIKQYKEEILVKDHYLIKENFHKIRLEKLKETQKLEISKLKTNLKKADALITAQDSEIAKLLKILNEADLDRLKQQKLYSEILQERDLLGTQLIRRNDELSLLYEKIKILTSLLGKGEVEYKRRVEEIRILKIKIRNLLRENTTLRSREKVLKAERRKIFKLEKLLLKERQKNKYLSLELEKPCNVHRWRILKGSKPEVWNLIKKTQSLQKKLIKKQEELIQKNLLIEEKEKLFLGFKKLLKFKNAAEPTKLAKPQSDRQIKALVAELNLQTARNAQLRQEISALTQQINALKTKYFKLKRTAK